MTRVRAWRIAARDCGTMTDAELVGLARQRHSQEAVKTLFDRHFGVVAGWVVREARHRKFSDQEVEAARQDAAFAFLRAVWRFDAGKGCSFATFLCRLVRARFEDFARRRRSAERLYDRSGYATHLLGGDPEGDGACGCQVPAPGGGWCDPSAAAERREVSTRLEAVLNEHGDVARRLWEGRVAGRSLHQQAPELGLSYGQAKRIYQKLTAALRDRLHGLVA